MIDTPEFQNWFGDSQVVDGTGRPLVVYHGTSHDIQTFEPRSGNGSRKLKAIYFSESPRVAAAYANFPPRDEGKGGGGANIIPVYLSLKNPLIFRGSDGYVQMGKYERSEVDVGDHDGIIRFDGNGLMVEVAVFDPAQIKSATGNSGRFDPADPDITDGAVRLEMRAAPKRRAP